MRERERGRERMRERQRENGEERSRLCKLQNENLLRQKVNNCENIRIRTADRIKM